MTDEARYRDRPTRPAPSSPRWNTSHQKAAFSRITHFPIERMPPAPARQFEASNRPAYNWPHPARNPCAPPAHQNPMRSTISIGPAPSLSHHSGWATPRSMSEMIRPAAAFKNSPQEAVHTRKFPTIQGRAMTDSGTWSRNFREPGGVCGNQTTDRTRSQGAAPSTGQASAVRCRTLRRSVIYITLLRIWAQDSNGNILSPTPAAPRRTTTPPSSGCHLTPFRPRRSAREGSGREMCVRMPDLLSVIKERPPPQSTQHPAAGPTGELAVNRLGPATRTGTRVSDVPDCIRPDKFPGVQTCCHLFMCHYRDRSFLDECHRESADGSGLRLPRTCWYRLLFGRRFTGTPRNRST